MSTSKRRWVTYCRVSTKEQGRSGLGLEAQKAEIDAFLAREGGEVLASFQEVASGDDDDRKGLQDAVALARRCRATLVVSKLCRLARVVAVIANLMRDGIDFLVTEIPNASPLELHLRAAFAQEERQRIASNTKAALQAAKARGVQLGSARPGHWKGREHRRQLGQQLATLNSAVSKRARWATEREQARTLAMQLRVEGASLQAVADKLNSAGHLTAQGCKWMPMQVARLLRA